MKESLGRNRTASVAAEEAWGTRLDAIGVMKVMTSRWGPDKGRGEVEIGGRNHGGPFSRVGNRGP